MRKMLIAAAATLSLAAPAMGQRAPIFDEAMDEEIVRAIPPGAEVEAMAPALDRMVGAMLGLDVGPILDAAEPWRRDRAYRPRGRTLRDLAGRDDPYFEDRLRGSIYGVTADMGRMMDAIAVAAPAMRRSLAEMERSMAAALRERPRRDERRDDEDWEYERYED